MGLLPKGIQGSEQEASPVPNTVGQCPGEAPTFCIYAPTVHTSKLRRLPGTSS